MRALSTIGVTFALALVASNTHSAEIRVPTIGAPSLSATVPDEWVIGEEHNGILNVADAIPSTIIISFSFLRDSRDPDRFVEEEMRAAGGNTPVRTKTIEISGHSGWLFVAAENGPSGRSLSVRHYIARVDAQYLVAIAVVLSEDAPEQSLATVDAIVASAKIHP